MPSSRKQLLIALAMIVTGLLLFFVFLGLVDPDADEHSLGLLDWVVGGMLLGPGFGYLLKWRATQAASAKRGEAP